MIKRLVEWRAHHPNIIVNNDDINRKETGYLFNNFNYLTFDKNAKNCEKLSASR